MSVSYIQWKGYTNINNHSYALFYTHLENLIKYGKKKNERYETLKNIFRIMIRLHTQAYRLFDLDIDSSLPSITTNRIHSLLASIKSLYYLDRDLWSMIYEISSNEQLNHTAWFNWIYRFYLRALGISEKLLIFFSFILYFYLFNFIFLFAHNLDIDKMSMKISPKNMIHSKIHKFTSYINPFSRCINIFMWFKFVVLQSALCELLMILDHTFNVLYRINLNVKMFINELDSFK